MSWMHQAHRAITRGQPCDKLATKSEADIGAGSLGHENDACRVQGRRAILIPFRLEA